MLPGFRFVLASVILSVSLVIFGLGAAGLLRTAHEKFATIPIRRPDPALMVPPALAMLRVDTPEQDSSLEPVLRNAPVEVPEVAPVLALANTLTESDITGPAISDPVSKARAEAMSGIAPVIAPAPVIATVETIPAATAEVAAAEPAPELSGPPATVPVAALPDPRPTTPSVEEHTDKAPAIAAVPVPEAPAEPASIVAAVPPATEPDADAPDAAMIAAPVTALPEIIASSEALIAATDVPLPRHRPASATARKSEPSASETAATETPTAMATVALAPSAPLASDVSSTGSITVAMTALPEITADANALIAAGDVKLPRERPTPTAAQTGEIAKKTKTARRKARSQRIVEQQPPPPPQPQTYRAEVLSFR